MKIATWNVQRPRARTPERRDRLRSLMQAQDADVWVLTETTESLAPSDGFSASFSKTSDRPETPGERWVGIWSRFPIIEQFAVRDSARSTAVRVQAGAQHLIVFGTVLPWVGSTWRGITDAGGAAFLAAVALQCEDWRELRTNYPHDALLVLGDFNQSFSPKHYYGSRAKRAGLTAALASVGLRVATGTPHDPVPDHSPARASIDHIAVPDAPEWANLAVQSWPREAKPPTGLSDHFGISIERAG